jgi:FAD/FMN-containing dehydrogenase
VLGFGETAGFACSKGASADTRTGVIATSDMRRVLGRKGCLVTVQAGITLTELKAYANSQQLTLPLGTIPAYGDLTVGGILATGAHRAGPKGASSMVRRAQYSVTIL